MFSGTGIKHLNSLFDFIPQRALEEIGYFDAVRNIEADTVDFDLLFTKEDIDEIYRNNWQNDTLVPTVNLTRKGIYKLTAVVRGKLTNVAFKGSDKRALCKNLEGISIYHPYVKVRNNRSTGNFDLYKYIGTFVKDDGKQIIEKPVYILVNKKGYREGGKGMVTEYLSKWVVGETASRYSIIPGNNVAPSYSNYGGNFLEDIPELINNNVIPKLNSQTNDVTKAGLDGVFHPASSIDYMFGLDGNNNDVRYQLNEEMSEDGEVEQASEVRPTNVISRKTYSGMIQSLTPNQVFVFGSNTQGRHGKGAALTAKNKFGAMYGQAEGPQGQSYAIITKDLTKRTHPSRTPEQIKEQIHNLYEYARENPDKEFLVAYSGTGKNLNAYSNQEMANMFGSEEIPNNIVFEEEFDKLISIQSEFNNKNEFPTDEMNHCIKS